jgi:hypothetical protein
VIANFLRTCEVTVLGTRTRTRTNTNPDGTEANAAGRRKEINTAMIANFLRTCEVTALGIANKKHQKFLFSFNKSQPGRGAAHPTWLCIFTKNGVDLEKQTTPNAGLAKYKGTFTLIRPSVLRILITQFTAADVAFR